MKERAAEMSERLRLGIDLEAMILHSGSAIRDQAKVVYGSDLLDARLCLVSALASLIMTKAGIPGVTTSSISDRLVLITSFAQGFPATETLISEGQYIKAAAVLKQDYEIVARLGEIRAGKATRGIQPNVRHAPAGSQRFYGELNDVAHPSNENILSDLLARLHRGEVNGVSAVPEFNREVARSLYELHVFTLLEIVREGLELHAEMYPSDLESARPAFELFQAATAFVEKAGFAKEPRRT